MAEKHELRLKSVDLNRLSHSQNISGVQSVGTACYGRKTSNYGSKSVAPNRFIPPTPHNATNGAGDNEAFLAIVKP